MTDKTGWAIFDGDMRMSPVYRLRVLAIRDHVMSLVTNRRCGYKNMRLNYYERKMWRVLQRFGRRAVRVHADGAIVKK